MMPTVKEALVYLGIDYEDTVVTANVQRALNTAVKTLHGAVGADIEEYMPGDPRAVELVFIYLDDLYSNRGVSAKVSNATRQLVATMEMQLKLELRQAREAVGV